jgi:hypothetical protein
MRKISPFFISAPCKSAGESCLYHVYVNVFCVKIQLWPILPENTVGISNYTHRVLEGGYRGGHSAEDFAPNPQTKIHV